jgi:acyl carrier protein
MSCPAFDTADHIRGAWRFQPSLRSATHAMTDQDRMLMRLVRAHAPAITSAGLASDTLDRNLDLRSDLGFDLVAVAELAVAIEDAFGIGIAMADLDSCRTIGDLQALIAARGA